jgi:hypothetical protein
VPIQSIRYRQITTNALIGRLLLHQKQHSKRLLLQVKGYRQYFFKCEWMHSRPSGKPSKLQMPFCSTAGCSGGPALCTHIYIRASACVYTYRGVYWCVCVWTPIYLCVVHGRHGRPNASLRSAHGVSMMALDPTDFNASCISAACIRKTNACTNKQHAQEDPRTCKLQLSCKRTNNTL